MVNLKKGLLISLGVVIILIILTCILAVFILNDYNHELKKTNELNNNAMEVYNAKMKSLESKETISTSQAVVSLVEISVMDYLKGAKDSTQGIIEANTFLKNQGGGTLIFPEGDYLIKPDQIYIPSNVNWIGEGKVRIYSQEKLPYNILISTERMSKNISIRNIIFDQLEDQPYKPNVNEFKGGFILHINDADEVTIDQCTFFTYGVCAVLAQSSYESKTETITVTNNQAYFERKVNSFYDVSVFNIDGRHVFVKNNSVESLNGVGGSYWKARCGYEVHMPDGDVSNNSSLNTEVGIIHVAWPMLWNQYEVDFVGNVTIENNNISKAIIGISCWGANTLENIDSKNITIKANTINLNLEDKYIPANGIAIVNGSVGNCLFENIRIIDNIINMTVEADVQDVDKKIGLLIPGQDVGAVLCNSTNQIKGMEISGNRVTNFPFSFLNINNRSIVESGNEQDKMNSNFIVKNNKIVNCAYIKTNDRQFEGLINLTNVSEIEISNNQWISKEMEAIYFAEIGINVNGLVMKNNDYQFSDNASSMKFISLTEINKFLFDFSYFEKSEGKANIGFK